MLGQATKSSTSFPRQVLPAGKERAETPRGRALRVLRSRIGQGAAVLFDSCGRERHFEGGESLARGGEAGNEVYIVLDGIVGLYHDLPSGEHDVLGYCYSGDLIAPARFGETWGFDAKALTSAQLLELGRQDFLSPGAGEEDLVWLLFKAACAELARRTARSRGYWFLPVKARLATFLFEIGDGIGEKSERGLEVHLPMFRDEIATYLGTRTETICRVLTGWKEKGLIVMDSPRNLDIPDGALLRADAFSQQLERP
jgi:CRP/FNR family transcriptional regulator